MSSVCAEQHKFHHFRPLLSSKKSLRDIDIPPRMVRGRRTVQESSDMYSDSPCLSSADESLLQKYLPYNTGLDSDDDSDPYSSDRFRIYEFKIRRCTRTRSHDWTDCPFAHPGEKARRRDPIIYRYSGTVCPEYRSGGCSRGDSCEFAHGVFESWLHPSRYRTEACKDGKNCKRKVCFFAHTPKQLRIVNENCHDSLAELSCKKQHSSCLFCHCAGHGAVVASPTSTLLGISHFSPPQSPSQSISPPLSPIKGRTGSVSGFSPITRYSDRFGGSESSSLMSTHHGHGMMSYKDVLTELMSSLKAVKFSETLPASRMPSNRAPTLPWVDVSFNCDDQQQFILSPSTTPPSTSKFANSYNGNYFNSKFDDNKEHVDTDRSCPPPDLDWVNDLLM